MRYISMICLVFCLFVFGAGCSGVEEFPDDPVGEKVYDRMQQNEVENIEENPGDTNLFTPGLM
ncbi:hypothetical protein ACFLQ8_00460 [Candidatus Auribacterota bacterium]